MEKVSFKDWPCALARALEIMGEWWSPLIIRDIFVGNCQFDGLVENLGISRNLLSRRIKSLCDNGIIELGENPNSKKAKIYQLTEKGKALIPILVALTQWGDKFTDYPNKPPLQFFHRDCESSFQAQIICVNCNQELDANAIVPQKGEIPNSTKGIAKLVQFIKE